MTGILALTCAVLLLVWAIRRGRQFMEAMMRDRIVSHDFTTDSRLRYRSELATCLINDCENLAMSRLHERRHLVIVRLKFLVPKHPRCRGFEDGKAGHGQFQDEGVVASGEIREKTRRGVGCKPLLDGEAFLHHSNSLTSLPELQVEHVADDDHEEPLLSPAANGGRRRTALAGPESTPQPRRQAPGGGNHEAEQKRDWGPERSAACGRRL